MKTKKSALVILFCTAIVSVALFAFAQSASPKGQSTATNDACLADMSAFVKEVARVRSESTIPPEEPWTVGANNGRLKRLGIVLSKTGVGDVGVITGKSGMDGEFATELLKRFPSGHVKWQGAVKSAKLDEETKAHVIVIPFSPSPTNVSYDIQPLTVKIPFAVLPREHAPKEGAVFGFEGDLKGDKDTLYQNSVDVIYWFSKADFKPGENRVWVVVSLADAKPSATSK
jgi:hypothetical protein